MEELSKRTSYTTHTHSLFTHIGSLSSYVGGIMACYKLTGVLKTTTTLELASIVVGALLAIVMTFFEGIYFNIFLVLLFQLIWLSLSVIVSIGKRYS